ncbi:MAG: DUF4249 family protein [Bacteroidota bacterium]|nr:DUF4249 family protein [Bacteroidota bacterium]
MKKYILFLIILFISCQKEIDIDLLSSNNQIVVEGVIEQNMPPYVLLTKSVGFFEPVTEEGFKDIFLKDAIVSVERDDGWKIDLIDWNDSIPELSYPIYAPSDALTGNYSNFSKLGYKYKLNIKWYDESQNDTIEVNSITSIPNMPTPPLDCVWVKKAEGNGVKDHHCYIWVQYSDPDTLGNSLIITYKRLEGTRKDNFFQKFIELARTDIIANGKTFQVYFATEPSKEDEDNDNWLGGFNSRRDSAGILLDADVVLFKFAQVDMKSYKFWRSFERSGGSKGNPFSEPMNLVSNINGGLGVWTGYGAAYYEVEIDTTTVKEGNELYQPINIIEIF